MDAIIKKERVMFMFEKWKKLFIKEKHEDIEKENRSSSPFMDMAEEGNMNSITLRIGGKQTVLKSSNLICMICSMKTIMIGNNG